MPTGRRRLPVPDRPVGLPWDRAWKDVHSDESGSWTTAAAIVMSKSRAATLPCAAVKSMISTAISTLSNAASCAWTTSATDLISTSEYARNVNFTGVPSDASSSNSRCASASSGSDSAMSSKNGEFSGKSVRGTVPVPSKTAVLIASRSSARDTARRARASSNGSRRVFIARY